MRFFWIVLALLFSSISSAQADLVSKEGTKYFYKNKEYKCEDLQPIYADSPEALEYYLSGRKSYSSARIMGYTGLTVILLSGALMLGNGNLEGFIIGGLGIAGGLIIEIIALVPLGRGSIKMKKAMNTFNYEMIEKHGYGKEVSLSIGYTGNGVGLVYSF